MAIPFALPSEDETETQGQQLEQLMLDLYGALQQVLRSRSFQHPSRNRKSYFKFLISGKLSYTSYTNIKNYFNFFLRGIKKNSENDDW